MVPPIAFGSTLADGSDYINVIECLYHTNGIVNDACAIIIYTAAVQYVNKILKIIFEQIYRFLCCHGAPQTGMRSQNG
jgi:hypothetical protein